MTSESTAKDLSGNVCVTPRHRQRYVNRHICPVCKRPLVNAPIEGAFAFTPFKHRLFEAIRTSGGIMASELSMMMYGRDDKDSVTSIRVHICQMRKELADASDLVIRHDKRKFGYFIERSSGEQGVG